MPSSRPVTISLTLPLANILWTLGSVLLADALAHVILSMPFANYPEGDFLDYSLFVFALAMGSAAAIVAGFALVASLVGSIVWALLRGPGTLRADDKRFVQAALFIHISVLVRSVAICANLTETMEGGFFTLPAVIWTSLASLTSLLALLSWLNWNARHAALGAAASVLVFGCAVWYAPAIYGWDLRPMGRYAILATAVPVLAFLALFLRSAPIFSKSRWLRIGTAIALFAALAYAVGAHMADNPPDVAFSDRLQAALSARTNPIRFSELTDFEWDALEMYNSYTQRYVFSALALEGTDVVSRSYLGHNEVGDLTVFIKDGEVVYYEMVWDDGHAFVSSGSPVVLTPEDAVFNVEYRDSGFRLLTLAE